MSARLTNMFAELGNLVAKCVNLFAKCVNFRTPLSNDVLPRVSLYMLFAYEHMSI